MKNLKTFLFGEKDTLVKRIVNYGLIFLVIAGFIEYGVKNNGDMSGLIKKETWETGHNRDISAPINDTLHTVSNRSVSF